MLNVAVESVPARASKARGRERTIRFKYECIEPWLCDRLWTRARVVACCRDSRC